MIFKYGLLFLATLCWGLGCPLGAEQAPEDEASNEPVYTAKGDTLTCADEPESEDSIAQGLIFTDQPTCLSTCHSRVYSTTKTQHSCTDTCDTDADCESGQTCVGCYNTYVCAKTCETDADCFADEDCDSGVCLWAT